VLWLNSIGKHDLARRLDRGQQQGDKDADDRDDHQQFHEGKTV